jgi:hypothetical protein
MAKTIYNVHLAEGIDKQTFIDSFNSETEASLNRILDSLDCCISMNIEDSYFETFKNDPRVHCVDERLQPLSPTLPPIKTQTSNIIVDAPLTTQDGRAYAPLQFYLNTNQINNGSTKVGTSTLDNTRSISNATWKYRWTGKNVDIVTLEVGTNVTTNGSHDTHPDFQGNTTGAVAGTYYYVCQNHSGMNGTIIVSASDGTRNNYTISVVNSGTNAYTLSGTNRNGAISGNNPTINIKVGDTLTLNINASGHPLWIQTTSGAYNSSSVVTNIPNNGTQSGTIVWATPTSRIIPMDWVDLEEANNKQITNSNRVLGPHAAGVLSAAAGSICGFAKNANLRVAYLYNTDDVVECIDAIISWHNSKSVNPETGVKNPTIMIGEYQYLLDRNTGVPINSVASITTPNGTVNRPVGGWGTDFTPFTSRNIIPFQVLDPVTSSFVWCAVFPIDSYSSSLRTALEAAWDAGIVSINAAGNCVGVYVKYTDPEYTGTYCECDPTHTTYSIVYPSAITKSTSITAGVYPRYPFKAYGPHGLSKGIDVAAGKNSQGLPILDAYTNRGKGIDIIGMGANTWTAYPRLTYSDGNAWGLFDGTSCAAPTVVGKAACIMEREFYYTGVWPSPDQVKNLLIQNGKNKVVTLATTSWGSVPSASTSIQNISSSSSMVRLSSGRNLNAKVRFTELTETTNIQVFFDPLDYIFGTIPTSINEGASGTFNLVTTNIPNNTTLYWTIDNITTTNADFSAISGSFIVNNNTGSFNISVIADSLTEGGETFTVSIRTTSTSGTVVATSSNIIINDTSIAAQLPPTYTFGTIPTSINEGTLGTFNLNTTNIPNNTTLYWTIDNITTTNADFSTTSGSFTINSNTGSFSIITIADSLTEGEETFTVSIRTNSTSGTVVATSSNIIINDTSITPPPTYTFGTIPTSINEGASGTFNLNTTNIPNNTTLYWTINPTTTTNADFSDISGSFTINNNTGSFNISVIADSLTEGEETFTVSIRTIGTFGTVVATSSNIIINDNSITPPPTPTYTFVTSPTSINEGSSGTFNLNTTNIPNNTTLYWTIDNITTTSPDFSATSGSFTINSNTGSFNISVIADSLTEGEETFTLSIRTTSTSGTVVAISNITINDTSIAPPPPPPPTYTFGTIPTPINEGTSGAFNLFTTNIPNNTTLYWTIDNITTTNADFSTTSGSFIVNNNTGSFNISVIADPLTGGGKTFALSIRTTSTSGTVVAISNITINDTSIAPPPPPTYTFDTIPISINEGSSGTFNLVTTNIPNNTTLYWTINPTTTTNADFSTTSGSFIVNNNIGAFNIITVEDSLTGGGRTFTVSIRTISTFGTVVATSSNIIINDIVKYDPEFNDSAYDIGGNSLIYPGLKVSIFNETEISYLNTIGEEIQVRGQQEPVSNYEYETELNEDNRKILLLKPEYLGVFIGDMKNIMSYDKSSETIDSKTKRVYNSKIN